MTILFRLKRIAMTMKVWKDVPGWFCDGDARFVSEICRKIVDGTVVEVGSFAGRSTAVMAPICIANCTELHCIDKWHIPVPQTDRVRGWRGDMVKVLRAAAAPHRATNLRHVFRRNMKSLGLWGALTAHQCDSAVGAGFFTDSSVNFCFIDADHTRMGLTRDIDAWWPKILPGAVIAGHDWHMRSVREAVHGFFGPLGLLVVRDRSTKRHACWAAVKPRTT